MVSLRVTFLGHSFTGLTSGFDLLPFLLLSLSRARFLAHVNLQLEQCQAIIGEGGQDLSDIGGASVMVESFIIDAAAAAAGYK